MAVNKEEIEERGAGLPITLRLVVAAFAAVLTVLFIIYWFALRTDYVPVFTQLPESDAAAVVAELIERKIDHRLANGGTTILVPSDQADQARLDIASSELPLRGQVGFELFNESDMGLTDFAQKINYQRALQGELARTIMLLDGIENARVHLAMPERTLFRGNRSAPTAAVTLLLQPGQSITANRINGIQRLVAGAVPELTVGAVAVLDETGRLVSANESELSSMATDGETEAVRQYYRARASAAIAELAPTLDFRVRVVVRRREEMLIGGGATAMFGAANVDIAAPSSANDTLPLANAPNQRNYAIEIEVITSATISNTLKDQLSATIVAAAALNQRQDDRLVFSVGPTSALAPSPTMPSGPIVTSRLPESNIAQTDDDWKWYLAIIAAALMGGLLMWWISRRGQRVSGTTAAIDSFTEQLRARLAMAVEGGDGIG
ncbi:MAG: flagellar basal-body MS-ring/collar protein FliF [Pseudomonadota bacterium]